MSNLIRWDPFGDRSLDRLFDESFVRPNWGWIAPVGAANLAIDMYETKDDVVVKAVLPGIKPEQVEVTITGDVLTIRGESKEENQVKEENYVRKERRFGSFSRCVTLPGGLKADKADAAFENGVLTLKIPKAEELKPKTIKVKTK
ncbi:MAG: Hsp20/alpha crystallin family protein [Chloroflexi bacterium]|nr:Hsp20/alpha crystallin family protein [Chloroflexota bacterium]